MISTKNLLKILDKSVIVCNIYDNEMDLVVKNSMNIHDLNEDLELTIAKKAFDTICGESVGSISYKECVAIFDIIDRNRK